MGLPHGNQNGAEFPPGIIAARITPVFGGHGKKLANVLGLPVPEQYSKALKNDPLKAFRPLDAALNITVFAGQGVL